MVPMTYILCVLSQIRIDENNVLCGHVKERSWHDAPSAFFAQQRTAELHSQKRARPLHEISVA